MEALITSTLLVALAEVGDKTQLLSFVLAARLKKPVPVLWGILVATLLNHALAAWAGILVANAVPPVVLGWLVGVSFILFGLWALKPDSLDEVPNARSAGVFATAFVAFFLVEMGDKTQFATVALAARFDALAVVVLGTTLGMMIANVPAVWFGERLTKWIPMSAIRVAAAALFVAIGLLAIWGTLNGYA